MPDNGFQSFANVISNDAEADATIIEVQGHKDWQNVHSSVPTDFNPTPISPIIQETAFIHPFVIGHGILGENVFVAPTAICRDDEGTPIHVGDYSNLQDGVVIHALETTENGLRGSSYIPRSISLCNFSKTNR